MPSKLLENTKGTVLSFYFLPDLVVFVVCGSIVGMVDSLVVTSTSENLMCLLKSGPDKCSSEMFIFK
jgi:hypothetical protein